MDKTHKDGIYIVKNGKIEIVEPPSSGFGKLTITWENNQPTRKEIVSSELIK